jgi:hypothetical protein
MFVPSHYSLIVLIPSPQVSVHTDTGTTVLQLYPGSSLQMAEHPSPGVKSSSSQDSPDVITPSLHFSIQVDGPLTSPPVQCHPGSLAQQSVEHLIESVELPSSQNSDPTTLLSPQSSIHIDL